MKRAILILLTMVLMSCEPGVESDHWNTSYKVISIVMDSDYTTIICEGYTKSIWPSRTSFEFDPTVTTPKAKFRNEGFSTEAKILFKDKAQYNEYVKVVSAR